jgi:hypothetical protein
MASGPATVTEGSIVSRSTNAAHSTDRGQANAEPKVQEAQSVR